VEIYSYNDHCSAPFSRACWLALAPPTLLEPGSRHCYGINYTCAVKGVGSLRVKVPPGNWFAPPGSNRSGGEGNEAVGASGVEGRIGDLASMQAVT